MMRQEARDKAKRKQDEASKERKTREDTDCRRKILKVELESSENENESGVDDDESQDVKVSDRNRRKKDVMSCISPTADRLGMSLRQRAMIAASVVKGTGQSVEDTNLSVMSAWRRAQTDRVKRAESIKSTYNIPTFVIVHWDGKNLTLRKGVTSERCCVYISGVPGDQKLLGIPEIPAGKGSAQESAVTKMLQDWHVYD